jgi:hypothetical protein
MKQYDFYICLYMSDGISQSLTVTAVVSPPKGRGERGQRHNNARTLRRRHTDQGHQTKDQDDHPRHYDWEPPHHDTTHRRIMHAVSGSVTRLWGVMRG